MPSLNTSSGPPRRSPYEACVHRAVCDEKRRKLLARQLQQAQKLAPAAVMATGLAHDFKNLLTTIRLHADLIGLAEPPEAPHQRHLIYIREAVTHANALLQRLAAFARPRPHRAEVLRLDQEITNMLGVLQGVMPDGIKLRVRVQQCQPVFIDAVELQQIVFNCVLNAKEAIKRAGSITIAVQRVRLSESVAGQFAPPLASGHYTELTISDTGSGIGHQVSAAAPQPFHESGSKSGWGLGLAVVHGCATRAGGAVKIGPAKRGTCIRIAFPEPTKHKQSSITPMSAITDAKSEAFMRGSGNV